MHIHSHSHPNGPVACNTPGVHYFHKVWQGFGVVCFVERLSHKTQNLDCFCLCVFKFVDKYKIIALFCYSFLVVPVGNYNLPHRVL